jgi:hypothetical protein
MPSPQTLLLVLLSLAAPGAEPAEDPQPPTEKTTEDTSAEEESSEAPEPLRVYDEVEVTERADDLIGIAVSAGEGTTGRRDLARRPILRPGELVETTPGVMATQHSGGGKANQYFVRGFNLDHGTDFSLSVDGVPVNMPTHGHGQGYADLSFLIPEVVERVRYRKGPYYADVGDFSAAGSVDMALVRRLPERLLQLTGGSHDYGRALWAQEFETGGGHLVAAAEGFHEDGPWTRGQSYDGWKGLLRYTAGDDERGHALTFMGYDAAWLSTDQVPRRAVDSGQIGRFDLIDPGPRGDTGRFSLSAEWHRGNSRALTRGNVYLLHYDFSLISNFTYFLENPTAGDQFEQVDSRQAIGFDLRRSWASSWGGRNVEWGAGLDGRFDTIENGLFRTRELVRTATVREDDIEQLRGGLWADASIRWHPKVRTRLGLRGDLFSADVESVLNANSGSADDFLLSPKASLVLGPFRSTELYLNLGYGYHSNDARGAVITVDPTTGEPAVPVEPLVRAKGIDIGFRTTAISGLQTTLTLFALELDSELVFVGDGGATEASRPSRRLGIEWTNHYRLNQHLSLDFDLTLTDATFTDEAPEGEHIPGAIGTTVAAGLSYDPSHSFYGTLRWRYFGDVPLIEDDSVEWSSSSLVNGRIGYRFSNGLDIALDVFNLLDSTDSDIEYYYASRLPGEPVGGVEDVHFHPVGSRSARLTVIWRR